MTDKNIFRMRVEDATEFMENRTLVTGNVTSGSVRTGDELFLHGGLHTLAVRVSGVEAFAKSLDFAEAGDRVGMILDDISVPDIPANAELSSNAEDST